MKLRNYHRRTPEQVLRAVEVFRLYHDLLHEQVQKGNIKSSVDRGAFTRPQEVLSDEILDLLGKDRRSNSYVYGPEKGDFDVRGKIADLENTKHGTSYTPDQVAMMPGAWAGLEFVLQEVVGLQRGKLSKREIAVIGPTLYQMFHSPIHYLGMNIIAYDFTVLEKSSVPSKEDIDEILDNNPKAIVISNPNNPDGKYISNNVLKHTIERCEEQNTSVIIDEMQNCFPTTEIDELRYGEWIQKPHVIRVDSASKRYALAEYRVGWVIADESVLGDRVHGIVGRMSGIMGNAPRAANTALMRIMQYELDKIDREYDFLKESKKELLQKEKYVLKRLEDIPRVKRIIARDACINLTFQVDYPGTDLDLAIDLMDKGTLIMPACGYGYDAKDVVMRFTFAERYGKLEQALDCLENVLT